MARIKLNSNFFHIPDGQSIQSYAVNPQAEAFSTQGASRRIDNTKLRRFVQGWKHALTMFPYPIYVSLVLVNLDTFVNSSISVVIYM